MESEQGGWFTVEDQISRGVSQLASPALSFWLAMSSSGISYFAPPENGVALPLRRFILTIVIVGLTRMGASAQATESSNIAIARRIVSEISQVRVTSCIGDRLSTRRSRPASRS
jgi:hypothetical protein